MADAPDNWREPARGGSAAARVWLQHLMLGAAAAAVIAVYAGIAGWGGSRLMDLPAADARYNLLVEGFQAGSLSLKKEVPRGLAQLADPYDPVANDRFRAAPYGLHDMSYFGGRLYLYFGVTPAVVLFWPWAAVTGHYLPERAAVAIFCAIGFLAGAGLVRALWRRYFAEVNVTVAAAGVLALGLANAVPLMLQRPDFWEVAVSCAFAFATLALAAVWRSLHEPARRGGWLAAASLAYGLAVGARPSVLFGAVILLAPVALALDRPGEAGRGRAWRLLAAAAGPIAAVGLGLMLYNFLRFDSPFEFGQRFQLAGDRQGDIRHFSPAYLGLNFRLYFLEPLRWTRHFPFVTDVSIPAVPAGHAEVVENPIALLTDVPLVWLALALPLGWRGRAPDTRALRRFLGAVAVLFATSALTICLFYSTSNRYETEFAPALIWLAVAGVLALEHAARAWRPAPRWLVRCAWSGLLVFSIALNLLASVERYAVEYYSVGRVLLESGRAAEAIPKFETMLRLEPGDPHAHNKLGIALLQVGRTDEALAQLREAVRLKSDEPSAHANLGIALAMTGRMPEARAQFREAIRLQPGNPSPHLNLAIALLESGRLPDAIAEFRAGLRLNANDPDLHAGLAGALLRAGQAAEAAAEYREALRLRPADVALRAGLEEAEARARAAPPD
ncbi:MAG TPA: tetratricopeptide repeat protein [Opitutaceae bacterium]|nr:tetratricopeptide repeat protein [Opitutaceae bacterium]